MSSLGLDVPSLSVRERGWLHRKTVYTFVHWQHNVRCYSRSSRAFCFGNRARPSVFDVSTGWGHHGLGSSRDTATSAQATDAHRHTQQPRFLHILDDLHDCFFPSVAQQLGIDCPSYTSALLFQLDSTGRCSRQNDPKVAAPHTPFVFLPRAVFRSP